MGMFSRFEDKAENVIEGGGGRGKGGIQPVKLAKRAYKEMQREKMVGVGHEYAPTLYNVLVSPADDAAMSGYYPTLAGEIETYLTGRAGEAGLTFECAPLVRFIVDGNLKKGRYDIIAESVDAAIVAELRDEELEHYGLKQPERPQRTQRPQAQQASQAQPVASGYSALEERDEFDFGDGFVDPVLAAKAAQRRYPPVDDPGGDDRTVLIGASQARGNVPRAALFDFTTQVRHEVDRERTTIGRSATSDIQISNATVSRAHAELVFDGADWLIVDVGSANGTRVNGRRVSEERIYGGDVLTFGNAELEFQEG